MSASPSREDQNDAAPPTSVIDGRFVPVLGVLAVGSIITLGLLAALINLGPRVNGLGSLRPLAHAAVATGAAGALFGSGLLAVGGELACLAIVSARREGDTAREIKRVQSSLMPLFAVAAGAAAWWLRPVMAQPAPQDDYLIAGTLAVLAFLSLIAERNVAAIRTTALPEAPSLRALAMLPVITLSVSACVQLALAADVFAAAWVGSAMCWMVVGVAAELAARGLGRCFLPAPTVNAARAPIESLLAQLLAGSVSRGGIAAPLRAQFGIDFSRSWALRYLRAAALPAVVLTALFCWVLSGLVLIGLDRRGVYERLGAPVGVLQPGLHLILPWPLGVARLVEFGAIHEIAIGSESGVAAAEKADAEGPPPPSATRLWDQAHPGEISTLIASEAEGHQSFQIVNADIRVLYRVGLSDTDAIRSATLVADPAALVGQIAGRRIVRQFAVRTLADILGTRRETMAENFRSDISADLAPYRSGIEIVGVAIEAVHPPAGAAVAYHEVQAAAVKARTSVAEAQGAAKAQANETGQQVRQVSDSGQAAAAETVQAAQTERIRFGADRAANAAGGGVFLLERYFADLVTGFAKAPLVILDDRLAGPTAPVIDLRPLAGAATPPLDDPD
jgi:regulator of protease activity HflC (stomatin/prohibitin superfamily)